MSLGSRRPYNPDRPLDPYGRGADMRPTPILLGRGAIVSAEGGPFMLGTPWHEGMGSTKMRAPAPQHRHPTHEAGPTCTKVVVRQVRPAHWVQTTYHPTLPWSVRCSCGHVITTQPQATWARAMAVAHAWVYAIAHLHEHEPTQYEYVHEHEPKAEPKRKAKAKGKRGKRKAKAKDKASKHTKAKA